MASFAETGPRAPVVELSDAVDQGRFRRTCSGIRAR